MPDVEGTLVRTATVDVHVVEVGTGDPVFLLHSNGLSWREGRGVMDQLSDSCRVLAWDMPGHGETAALPQTTVPDLAQVLIETVEALGLRDVTLVGTSAGAYVATEVARSRPDLVRLLVLAEFQPDSRSFFPQNWNIVEATFGEPRMTPDEVAARLHRTPTRALVEEWNADRARAGRGGMLAVMRALGEYDMRAAIAALAVPAELVAGDRGLFGASYPDLVRDIGRSFPVTIVEGAGHFVGVDQPRLTSDAIRDGLARNPPAGTADRRPSRPPVHTPPPQRRSESELPSMVNDLTSTARSHSLSDLLRRTAARHGQKPAVIDGDRALTYAELDDVVSRMAASLQARGLGQGDRIALVSRNCWQFAVLSFASARMGAVLVPINFMLTAAEVGFILDHAGVSALVVDDEHRAAGEDALRIAGISGAIQGWIGAESAVPAGWEAVDRWMTETSADQLVAVHVDDETPIRLMYTSGTESKPKGALLPSRALIAQYVSAAIDGGMAHDDVDLHTMPLYHCAQLDCFLGPDVYLGATSIILPAPDPEQVLAAIERHRVTKYFAPPTVWISLLNSPHFDSYDLSSLRKGYYGASPMPVEVLRQIQEKLPDVSLWNFYGQTEMAPVATILQPSEQIDRAGSAGRPVLNVETRVVDDDGHPVPAGEMGEVVHRSPQAMTAYWRDEEKTREAFRSGWFHSGDLGRFDEDGYLTIVDRRKDMIKSGGENVASREVEEVLYSHPLVAEVAVFGLPDAKWVEAVVAAIVAVPGETLTAEALEAHCADRLARFKTPKRFIIVDSLPKNPSGKILKRDLRVAFGAQGDQQEPAEQGAGR